MASFFIGFWNKKYQKIEGLMPLIFHCIYAKKGCILEMKGQRLSKLQIIIL